MKILETAALLVAIWLMAEMGYSVHYWRNRSIWTIDKINQNLKESAQMMDQIRQASGALNEGAKVWSAASRTQAAQTTSAMQSVDAAAKQLISFVSRTDLSVNSSLLPTISKAVQEQSASLLVNQEQLKEGLERTQKLLADADQQINNPAIANSLASIDEAAQHSAETTKQLSLAMTDIRLMADKAKETYLKPVNLWWAILKEAIGIGGSVGAMVK